MSEQDTYIEITGNLIVHHPVKKRPRTWCGIHRCCREANHDGACEVDITYLTHEELASIEASRKP